MSNVVFTVNARIGRRFNMAEPSVKEIVEKLMFTYAREHTKSQECGWYINLIDQALHELADWVRSIKNPYTDKNVERMWAYHRAKLNIAKKIIK